MQDIRNLEVVQIRLFPQDSIPYKTLGVPNTLEKIKTHFQFGTYEIPLPLYEEGNPKVIIFRSGETKSEHKRIIVDNLVFEERKINFTVLGTSEEANYFFSNLASLIHELVGENIMSDDKCLIKSEETKCDVRMNINFWEIFSVKMRGFIRNELPKAQKQSIMSVIPKRMRFQIDYKQDSDLFYKEHIQISPKLFTIEPKAGMPFDKRVFFTHSPCDSDTHLKLIQEFEQSFLNKKNST